MLTSCSQCHACWWYDDVRSNEFNGHKVVLNCSEYSFLFGLNELGHMFNISAGWISDIRLTRAVKGKKGWLAIRLFIQNCLVHNVKNITEILPFTWILAILEVTWYTCTKMIREMTNLFARNTKIGIHQYLHGYCSSLKYYRFSKSNLFQASKWPKFCRRYFQMHELCS